MMIVHCDGGIILLADRYAALIWGRRDLEEANTAKAGLELRLTREHNEWQAKIAAAERERQSAARRV